MKIKIIHTIIVSILIVSCSTSKKIDHYLDKTTDDVQFYRGLVVYNTKTNKEEINYNGNKYFTPASNTKLFTFYSAYRSLKDSILGLQYFEKEDTLIIKGTADPTFLYGFEENKTLEFLRNSGKQIVVEDDQIDDDFYGDGWSWNDFSYYYMPEKNLFPIYGNIVELNKSNHEISTNPEYFKKFVSTENSDFIRGFMKNKFFLDQNKDVNNRLVPFKTSNNLLVELLSDTLNRNVTLKKPVDNQLYKDFYSVKSDSVYKQMMVESDNFIAEQLMLQVGYSTTGLYDVEEGIEFALENYLVGIPQKPRWVDGSGLSRYNLFTPESIVYLLRKMHQEIPKEKLLNYFPVGGKSGTLKNYYANEKPFIYAKTGTLSNNHNVSGYLITKKGTVLIFSYMNNHYMASSNERKKEMAEIFFKLYNSL